MGNPLPRTTLVGTLGELFSQLQLLEFGVQSAPPIKDSGNDLVAIKGRNIKQVQVKTNWTENLTQKNYQKFTILYFMLI